MSPTSQEVELLKQFEHWKPLQPDIKSSSHEELNRSFSQFKEDIIEMGYRADFSSTRQFTSHRRIFGPIIAQIKKLIFILIRPVMRVFLGPQVRFNHLVVNLAYRVALLEKELHEINASKQIKETGK
jgi:hypothetical protein